MTGPAPRRWSHRAADETQHAADTLAAVAPQLRVEDLGTLDLLEILAIAARIQQAAQLEVNRRLVERVNFYEQAAEGAPRRGHTHYSR